MTAYMIGYEVACDGPDEETDCPQSAAIRASFDSRTARQVRADGRRDGWTARRRASRLRDVCPDCAGVPEPYAGDHRECLACGHTMDAHIRVNGEIACAYEDCTDPAPGDRLAWPYQDGAQ